MTSKRQPEVVLRWSAMRRSAQWDVKGAVALAGAFGFLHGCMEACLFPFLTLYLRHQGLTATMVGVVMGIKHLLGLLWGPAAAFLARRHDWRRTVITGSLVCSAFACLIFSLIPAAIKEAVNSPCNSSQFGPVGGAIPPHVLDNDSNSGNATSTMVSTTALLMGHENTSYHLLVNISIVPSQRGGAVNPTSRLFSVSGVSQEAQAEDTVSVDSNPKANITSAQNGSQTLPMERQARSDSLLEQWGWGDGERGFFGGLKVMDAQHQLFFLAMITVGLWEVLAAPLGRTAADGLFEYLDFVDATDRYGAGRSWDLLGRACGVCGVGLLVSSLTCVITWRHAIHFYGYVLFAGLTLPAALLLPMYQNKKREMAGKAAKALHLVRAHPRALLCALTAFLAGAADSMVHDFLFWRMQDCGSSELQMGVALALSLLSQLAFRLSSGRLPWVLTPSRALWLSTACLALQCLYYSFLWAPWAVLPVQPLGGLGAGTLWWAVHHHSEDVAVPGTERNVRGVFRTLSAGLGASLGSFAGGVVVQRFRIAVLFRSAALGLAFWTLLLPLLQARAPHQRRINYSRLLTADTSEGSDSESDHNTDWLEKAMEDDKTNNNW